MEILSVYDPVFREYGSIVDGYDFTEILTILEDKAMRDAGIQIDGTAELGATLGVHVGPGAFGVICVEQ